MTKKEFNEKIEKERQKLPPELRDHPYGFLLKAYFEHKAIDATIKYNFPHAVLNDDVHED